MQVDVGGGSCRKHGGGRRCVAEGCMKTDVGGEWLLYTEIDLKRWCKTPVLDVCKLHFALRRSAVEGEGSFSRAQSPPAEQGLRV